MTLREMIRLPGAFLPILMSLCALALVLGFLALYGVVREPDEGAAARLFQLLIVAQVPIIGFFAVKWLRRSPGQALVILALQVGAAVAAVALVLILER